MKRTISRGLLLRQRCLLAEIIHAPCWVTDGNISAALIADAMPVIVRFPFMNAWHVAIAIMGRTGKAIKYDRHAWRYPDSTPHPASTAGRAGPYHYERR